MNDTFLELSRILIVGGSVLLVGSVSYAIVRWVTNTQHPWGVIKARCRKVWPVVRPLMLFMGIGYIIEGAVILLMSHVFENSFPNKEIIKTTRLGSTSLVGGVAYVVVGLVGRRLCVPPTAARGSVWIADLRLPLIKLRPCLILNVPSETNDRMLLTVVPHSRRVKGTRFEVDIPASFLKDGAFDAQQVVTIAPTRLLRPVGDLNPADLEKVEAAVRRWLEL